jgi:hypothetical protein
MKRKTHWPKECKCRICIAWKDIESSNQQHRCSSSLGAHTKKLKLKKTHLFWVEWKRKKIEIFFSPIYHFFVVMVYREKILSLNRISQNRTSAVKKGIFVSKIELWNQADIALNKNLKVLSECQSSFKRISVLFWFQRYSSVNVNSRKCSQNGSQLGRNAIWPYMSLLVTLCIHHKFQGNTVHCFKDRQII